MPRARRRCHARRLLNHNLRWIDWPHSHGDPNEYWNQLGSRSYIGGPRVLNASELQPVLASPYMFARKVDVDVDPHVLRLWDRWMAAKLAGTPAGPTQAPIGHSPGDPELSTRFRAPGLAAEARARARRIARIDFDDGSRCGCGDACDAIGGGCCAAGLCAGHWRAAPSGAAEAASNPAASAGEAMDTAMDTSLPCPTAPIASRSAPGGASLTLNWVNRARHPVALSVLNFDGEELPMRTLSKPDATAAFRSQRGVVWRARALSGALMLELTPADEADGAPIMDVAIPECRFGFRGAAALLAASPADPTAPVPWPALEEGQGQPSAWRQSPSRVASQMASATQQQNTSSALRRSRT